jgi:hypothetical protein
MSEINCDVKFNGTSLNLGDALVQAKNKMLSDPNLAALVHRCKQENLAEDLVKHLRETGMTYEAFLATVIIAEFMENLVHALDGKAEVVKAQAELKFCNPTVN